EARLRPGVQVPLDPLALCVSALDQPRPRRPQFAVGLLAVADVAEVAGKRRRPRKTNPRNRELEGELDPVLVLALELQPAVEDDRLLGFQEAGKPLTMPDSELVRHDQVGHVPTDRLVRGIPEGSLGRGVPTKDDGYAIHP